MCANSLFVFNTLLLLFLFFAFVELIGQELPPVTSVLLSGNKNITNRNFAGRCKYAVTGQ